MNRSADYPRVLVLGGEPPSSVTATGITLRNLFSDWPREKLAVTYSTPFPPDWECAERFYQLSTLDRGGVRGHGGVRVKPDAGTMKTPTGYRKVNSGTIKGFCRRLTLDLLELLPPTPAPEFTAWVNSFSPELVYTLGASTLTMRPAARVAGQFNIPAVIHFMDNWIETGNRGPTQCVSRRFLLGSLHDLLSRSNLFMTISPEMSAAYSSGFHLPGYDFMNCVPAKEFNPAPSHDGPLGIFYIGGLHLNRWKCLLQVADVIRREPELANRYRVVVFAPEKDWSSAAALHRNELISYGGNLSYNQVAAKAAEADVLLHVESFTPECVGYTKYSISTKLAEYSMAGRPILGFAPKNLASMREVERTGGPTAENAAEIAAALTRLTSAEERSRLGRQANAYALNTHSAEVVRQRFLDIIRQSIGQHRETASK